MIDFGFRYKSPEGGKHVVGNFGNGVHPMTWKIVPRIYKLFLLLFRSVSFLHTPGSPNICADILNAL